MRTLEVRRLPRAVPAGEGSGPAVGVVNGFRLRIDDRMLLVPVAAQRLLAFLALRQEPMLRAYVAGSLWPDVTDERAAGNLRTTLWRVARLAPIVGSSRHHLWLEPEVAVDVREATAIASRILDDHSSIPALANGCTALLGDLLPDWYDEWAILERERFRELRIQALETMAWHMLQAGRCPVAIRAAQAAVLADPLRESSHRLVVEAHAAEGNVAAALRQFESFQAALRRELGVEPSSKMTALVDGILAGVDRRGRQAM